MKSLIPTKIVALDVFLEKRKTRIYVGRLSHKIKKGKKIFHFEYDLKYLHSRNIIPLGPDLLLTKQIYESEHLFPSLQDRIPSKENPAYIDYCHYMGISVTEQDPIILLASIGKRGPSSFVFEPIFTDSFSVDDLIKYRQELNLTIREFGLLFDISYSNLQRIESKKISGKDILKRLQIYYQFPEVTLYEVLKCRAIHSEKKRLLILYLEKKLRMSK